MKQYVFLFIWSVFAIIFFVTSIRVAYASYESYGSKNDVDFLLIPETFTWRQYPRVWTILKFSNSMSKFSLVYSLEEADCSKNLLRNLSQTWVKRGENINNRLDQNRKVKLWRELNDDKFEDKLHTFLCTYKPSKKEKDLD
mgnify:FL=1